jgi:chromosome segregation ATPase
MGHAGMIAGNINFSFMKKTTATKATQKLAGEAQTARIRLARAESELTSTQEQWRMAKRRRKEAKQAARRARKQFKLAKANVSDATQALTKAEKKLLEASPRVTKNRKPIRQPAKPKLATKAAAKPMSSGPTMTEAKTQPIGVPREFEAELESSAPLPAGTTTIAQA